jgi:hypothetical protein
MLAVEREADNTILQNICSVEKHLKHTGMGSTDKSNVRIKRRRNESLLF